MATIAPIKVDKDNIESNKASIPLAFKASLLTFLPILLKKNPKATFTKIAMLTIIKLKLS